MAKRQELDYRLRLSNHHLSNIYDTGYYLEVGNLDANFITRIINGEEVSFYETINPDIARLSPSKIAEVEYDEILQLLYFYNKKAIDTSEKIFLTCGILKWKSSKDSEIFAPIVLIPIRINFKQDEQITIKRTGKIIENKYLIEEIKRRMSIDIPRFDRPETIFDIDVYGELVAKLTNSFFELGNFITYARVDYIDIDLNRNKFSPQRSYMNYDLSEIHLYPLINLNLITKVNKEQKDAIIVASEGKSFAIDGKLGTGKTTTAINIIANKIKNNQKVLYISNDMHSLHDFKKRMVLLHLDKYIFDFDNPLEVSTKTIEESNPNFTKENYQKITELTHQMTNYEKALSSKINGYRYNEIYHQISRLSRLEKANLVYPKQVNLHRHEVELIEPSIRQIEGSLSRLDQFSSHSWHCLHDTLKESDEEKIKDALKQFKISQLQGQMVSDKLFSLFHFEKTTDIRLVRRLIYNYNSLKNYLPPKSWTEENLNAFYKASSKVKELEEKIKQYYNVSEELSEKFDYRITSINIDEMIQGLYGDYFKQHDIEKVNQLLQYKKQVLRLALSIENNKNNFVRLKGQLNNHFGIRKVELGTLTDLHVLISFLELNRFDKKWIGFSYTEKANLLKKMKNFEEYFLNYQSALVYVVDSFVKSEPELILQTLEPFQKKGKAKYTESKTELKQIKKYLKPHVWKDPNFNYTKVMQKLKKYIELEKDYQRQCNLYEELFGNLPELYLGLTDHLSNAINVIEKYRGNKEFPIRNYLLYYANLSLPEQRNALKDLQTMATVQKDIERSIEDLKPFGFKVRGFNFESRLQEIAGISLYLKKLYRSNDYLKSLILKSKTSLIVDDYMATNNISNERPHLLKMLDSSAETVSQQIDTPVLPQSQKDALRVDDYFYIKKLLEEKHDVLTFLENSEFEYKYLYGQYYKGLNTEIAMIRQAIEKFTKFIKMIPTPENVVGLFQPERYAKFQNEFEQVSYFYEKWMRCFREYSKYFKENIIAYIDNTFSDNVIHIDELVSHQDSLRDYLVVLEHSSLLKEYRLDDIVKKIFSGELNQFIENGFLYQYFLSLSDDFINRYQEVQTLDQIPEILSKIDQYTDQLLKENLIHLQKQLTFDYERLIQKIKRIKPNNYSEYFKATEAYKYVYICDSDIVLSGLDISLFDTVIVDDAHIANSNKYVKIADAKQLIIIGDKDAKSSIANNLISRVRLGNTIPLKFCYARNNKILLDYKKEKDNNRGIIDDFLVKDSGLHYIESFEEITEYVIKVYQNDPQSNINVYVGNDVSFFETYKQLSNRLINLGLSSADVIRLLKFQIRISDARINYIGFADYNIFYYNDYIDVEEIVLEITLTSVMTVRKQLIIYHKLTQDKVPIIRKPLEVLIQYESKYKKWKHIQDTTSIRYPLGLELEKHGYKVYQGFGMIDLIFKKKQQVFGIILYSEPQKLDIDFIEDYENYVKTYALQGVKIYMVFSKNLCDRFESEIQNIVSNCEGHI